MYDDFTYLTPYGFEGYIVSEVGEVREVEHDIVLPSGEIRHREAAILTPRRPKGSRYYHVDLLTSHGWETVSVHRLVAMAYLEPDPVRTYVNHIDRITTNNSIDNLEWCTNRENILHSRSQDGFTSQFNTVWLIKDGEVRVVTCAESKILRKQGWEYGNGIDTPWTSSRFYLDI